MNNDLISRTEVIKLIDEFGYINCHDCKDFEANNRVDKIRLKVVETTTAYDLESVIEQLEKKRDECYSEMEKERNETDYFSEHIFEEYHNKGMAFNEALEIIKSGTTAKNGG